MTLQNMMQDILDRSIQQLWLECVDTVLEDPDEFYAEMINGGPDAPSQKWDMCCAVYEVLTEARTRDINEITMTLLEPDQPEWGKRVISYALAERNKAS